MDKPPLEQPHPSGVDLSASSGKPEREIPQSRLAVPPLNLRLLQACKSVSTPANCDILQFLITVGRLKALRRSGWVAAGITRPESVAAHMYRVAMSSLMVPTSTAIDRMRCVKMCLIHDLAESLVGDITPYCGVSAEDKLRMESEAMEDILKLLDIDTATEFRTLWNEYLDGSTSVARFVHDCDKFDMVLQALEYESDDTGLNLDEFFRSTRGKFGTEIFGSLAEDVETIRAAALHRGQHPELS